LLISALIIIQDILLIEEKARIFRNEVRFNIPKQPIQALIKIDTLIRRFLEDLNSINGINFCQVLIIEKITQDIPSLTSGNQKYKGNIPNLVRRAKLTISGLRKKTLLSEEIIDPSKNKDLAKD